MSGRVASNRPDLCRKNRAGLAVQSVCHAVGQGQCPAIDLSMPARAVVGKAQMLKGIPWGTWDSLPQSPKSQTFFGPLRSDSLPCFTMVSAAERYSFASSSVGGTMKLPRKRCRGPLSVQGRQPTLTSRARESGRHRNRPLTCSRLPALENLT